MNVARLIALGVLAYALGGCASTPLRPPLVESYQAFESRAQENVATGNVPAALTDAREALHAAELADNRAAMVTNLLNIGVLQTELGAYDAARSAYARAHQIAMWRADDLATAQAASGLAEVAYRQGDLQTAYRAYRRLAEDPSVTANGALHVVVLNGLALSAAALDRMDEARQLLAEAQRFAGSAPKTALAATLLNRATLELRSGRLDRADQAARQALEIDRRAENTVGIAADLDLLGQIAARRGQAATAAMYRRQTLVLYDRLGAAVAAQRVRSELDGPAAPAAFAR